MTKCCIGIDLGGTFIKFGLVDADMNAGETSQVPTPSGADNVVAQMVAGAKQLLASHDLSRDDVLAVGIGSPGPISISDGIILSLPNIPGMDNLPLRDRVSEGLGIPAVLENDANAAAYGEYVGGAGKGARNIVMLTLGTGVGSGIVVDGKLVHGEHELGGELGHMIVQPGGELCNCGQRGCLERYASATYMGNIARRLIEQEGRPSSLQGALDRGETIDAKAINEARRAGDAVAADAWDKAMFCLAIGCVNISRIFDPEKIILGGGMAKAGDDLLAPLHKHYYDLHWTATEPMSQIVLASLGNDAGSIGAAGVAWQAFGNGPAR